MPFLHTKCVDKPCDTVCLPLRAGAAAHPSQPAGQVSCGHAARAGERAHLVLADAAVLLHGIPRAAQLEVAHLWVRTALARHEQPWRFVCCCCQLVQAAVLPLLQVNIVAVAHPLMGNQGLVLTPPLTCLIRPSLAQCVCGALQTVGRVRHPGALVRRPADVLCRGTAGTAVCHESRQQPAPGGATKCCHRGAARRSGICQGTFLEHSTYAD